MTRPNVREKFKAWREERRLDRQFRMLSRTFGRVIGVPLNAVRPGGRASLLLLPVGVLLIAGGVFSFLPGLGLWMLPLGLMLIAVDVPFLRRPVSGLTIRSRRFLQNRWRAWFRKAAGPRGRTPLLSLCAKRT